MSKKYEAYNNVRLRVENGLIDMEGAAAFLNTQDELLETMREQIVKYSKRTYEQSATIARLEAEVKELRDLIKRRPPNNCCNLEMIAEDGQWNSFGEVTEQAKLDAKMLLEIIQREEVSDAAED